MKTYQQCKRHIEWVQTAFDRYGDAIMKTISDLFDPESPAFFRVLLRRQERAGVPFLTQLRDDLEKRVEHHDRDKLSILDTLQDVDLSATRKEVLVSRYALHDLRCDHHVSCWIVDSSKLQASAFIEHLLDHAAVNMEQGLDPFDIAFLQGCRAFTNPRSQVNGVGVSDVAALLNLGNPDIIPSVHFTRKVYKRWVDALLPTLQIINNVR